MNDIVNLFIFFMLGVHANRIYVDEEKYKFLACFCIS